MKRETVLEQLHPLVSFCYFLLVLLLSMTISHPACVIISLVGAISCLLVQEGAKSLKKQSWILIPALLAAVINPMFTHKGMTLLCYLPGGNPLTLESILYGLGAAGLLCALLLWFRLCTDIMTTEKLLWLFGRAAPALSLLFSMTLRFVPRLSGQLKKILNARRALLTEEPGRTGRLKGAAAALSALITWALEDALNTADSMKARGYGLPGRTAYSIYRLEERDRLLLVWLGFCGFFLLSGWAAGGFRWHYYPNCGGSSGALCGALRLCQMLLCLTPVLAEAAESLRFRMQKEGRVNG